MKHVKLNRICTFGDSQVIHCSLSNPPQAMIREQSLWNAQHVQVILSIW